MWCVCRRYCGAAIFTFMSSLRSAAVVADPPLYKASNTFQECSASSGICSGNINGCKPVPTLSLVAIQKAMSRTSWRMGAETMNWTSTLAEFCKTLLMACCRTWSFCAFFVFARCHQMGGNNNTFVTFAMQSKVATPSSPNNDYNSLFLSTSRWSCAVALAIWFSWTKRPNWVAIWFCCGVGKALFKAGKSHSRTCLHQ